MAEVIIKTCSIKQYDCSAYQIMPDHVHILIYNKYHQARAAVPARARLKGRAPTAGCARGEYFTISELIHGFKSYFVDQIRDKYKIDFQFFQSRFYARIVNSQRYFNTIVDYIKHNPPKANLPSHFCKYPYQGIFVF